MKELKYLRFHGPQNCRLTTPQVALVNTCHRSTVIVQGQILIVVRQGGE